jgi:hypothetical protein
VDLWWIAEEVGLLWLLIQSSLLLLLLLLTRKENDRAAPEAIQDGSAGTDGKTFQPCCFALLLPFAHFYRGTVVQSGLKRVGNMACN